MPEWVYMPKLGVNMTEGQIISWLVEEGEAVEAGHPLLEVETDKAVQEVKAPASGVVAKIVYGEGETIPCTYVIAAITAEGEELPDDIPLMDEASFVPQASFATSRAAESESTAPEEPEPAKESVRISPVAKKLAEELGVDYTTIQGTGGGGRIKKADVLAAAEQAQAPTAAPRAPEGPALTSEDVIPVTGIRALIAERMLESAQGTARVTLIANADATQLVKWREQLRRGYPEQAAKLGYNELLIVVVAHALKAFPYMNATLREDGIHLLEEINIGVAVDTERGLLVPVIKGADQQGIFDIHRVFRRLVEMAQSGRSDPDELTGGTFTITNLGMYEIDAFTPIINPPEVAVLGVGQISPMPVVANNQIVIQQRMTLSLVFDHRLVDGAPAGRFLQHVKHLIEAPYMLVLPKWTL